MNLHDDLDSWLNLASSPGPAFLPLLEYSGTGLWLSRPLPDWHSITLDSPSIKKQLFLSTFYCFVPLFTMSFSYCLLQWVCIFSHTHSQSLSVCLQKKPQNKQQTKTTQNPKNLKTAAYGHWLMSSEIPEVAGTYLVQSGQHLLKLMVCLEVGHLQLASCCTIIFLLVSQTVICNGDIVLTHGNKKSKDEASCEYNKLF